MNRCNQQLPSHLDPAIVVIKIIHFFRQFIDTYDLTESFINCLEPSKN